MTRSQYRIPAAQEKRGKRSPLKALVILLAIVVVTLYVIAGTQISQAAQGRTVDYDARDYIYSAEYGRFGALYDTALYDMNKHAEYSAEVEECRALAFYYEQAVLEHAYREAGDDAKADEFAKRMEEYEAQLGSMSGRAEAVRKALAG